MGLWSDSSPGSPGIVPRPLRVPKMSAGVYWPILKPIYISAISSILSYLVTQVNLIYLFYLRMSWWVIAFFYHNWVITLLFHNCKADWHSTTSLYYTGVTIDISYFNLSLLSVCLYVCLFVWYLISGFLMDLDQIVVNRSQMMKKSRERRVLGVAAIPYLAARLSGLEPHWQCASM